MNMTVTPSALALIETFEAIDERMHRKSNKMAQSQQDVSQSQRY